MPCSCGPNSCKDFDEEREGVSKSDVARFGGDAVNCPSCGAEVYHDVALCHSCGHAMTDESMGRSRLWVPLVAAIVAVAIGAVVMLRVLR